MDKSDLPLVSVPVGTYNSSSTVIETLDSIYNQTYPNIELIVSDDCSTDNTVEICRQWIEEHKDRFARTELLTVEKNTGISANCNRAQEACQGEWVKGIAGDDILLPNCIQDCVTFVSNNTGIYCLFGKMDVFNGSLEYETYLRDTFSKRIEEMAQMSQEELYHTILHGDTPPAPTFFYKKGLYEQYGIKNDERIPLIEDWPKWLNMLKAGIRVGFLPKYIVKYRLGGISTTNQWKSEAVFRSKRLIYFLYQHEEYLKEDYDKTINEVVDYECNVYHELLKTQEELSALKKLRIFRIRRKLRKLCKMKTL